MKKGSILFIIISLIILAAVIGVVQLSIKNSKLKFLSDDARQVVALKEIYQEVILTKSSGNINVTGDSSIYKNFITYSNFSDLQKAEFDTLLASFTTTEEYKDYTISSTFDIKKLQLAVVIENNSIVDTSMYVYELNVDKENNKIIFEQISYAHAIE